MGSQPTVNPFPNATTFISSKLTPDTIADLLQPLLIQIVLGKQPPAGTDPAFSVIRIGWQDEGQPGPQFGKNYCSVTATPTSSPYSKVNDGFTAPISGQPQNVTQNFTRVEQWRVDLDLWGPNSFSNASLIRQSMSFVWVQQYLINPPNFSTSLFPFPATGIDQPVYAPEPFQRKWWPRTHLVIPMYELIYEQTSLPAAQGVSITLTTDTGVTRTITAE